jgi:hypothetical protein
MTKTILLESQNFSDRELVKETLKEIVDAIVEELLQPKENELIPRSD